MDTNTHTPIYTNDQLLALVKEVAAAEAITHEKLGILSRQLLINWQNDKDPSVINALMGVNPDGKFILTPMNWRTAALYFHEFVGAKSNYEELKDAIQNGGKRSPMVFGVKTKNAEKRTKKAREEWLSDETNNIWVWSRSIQLGEAPNLSAGIKKAIETALNGTEATKTRKAAEPLSLPQVLDTILSVDGINVQDLFDMLRQDEAA